MAIRYRTIFYLLVLTGHVHHPAVAVLYDVAGLTVDPAGSYTIDLEKARLESFRFALSPRGRQVGQLQGKKKERSLETGVLHTDNNDLSEKAM